MQVFVPYKEPLMVAKCLDTRRLNKQVIECGQIIDAIEGKGKGWFNHPIVKMYKKYLGWLKLYSNCMSAYLNFICNGSIFMSAWGGDARFFIDCATTFNNSANKYTPPFLTDVFCDQHKRRLYTKDPVFYKVFAQYGTSEENWYVIDSELVKYINGKRIN